MKVTNFFILKGWISDKCNGIVYQLEFYLKVSKINLKIKVITMSPNGKKSD